MVENPADIGGKSSYVLVVMLPIRAFLLLWVACALPLALARGADSSPAPLLPNAGFETDNDGDRWPDQWGRAKIGGTWEDENGNHFIRLKSAEPGQMVMLYQQVRFDARILMDFKDAAGKKLSGAPAPNSGKNTEGWVERKVQFLVPEGAVTLDFMPALFNVESGTLDLDDVVL